VLKFIAGRVDYLVTHAPETGVIARKSNTVSSAGFWRRFFVSYAFYGSRVVREIATQDHSGSFILQSITGRQEVAYRNTMFLALSLKFLKK